MRVNFMALANDIGRRHSSARHLRRAAEREQRKMSAGFDRKGRSNVINGFEAVGTSTTSPHVAATMTRGEAKGAGYTGDVCIHCGSTRMRRTGHCATCEGCGSTTGCS